MAEVVVVEAVEVVVLEVEVEMRWLAEVREVRGALRLGWCSGGGRRCWRCWLGRKLRTGQGLVELRTGQAEVGQAPG